MGWSFDKLLVLDYGFGQLIIKWWQARDDPYNPKQHTIQSKEVLTTINEVETLIRIQIIEIELEFPL